MVKGGALPAIGHQRMRREDADPLAGFDGLRGPAFGHRVGLALNGLIGKVEPSGTHERAALGQPDKTVYRPPFAIDGLYDITKQIDVVHFALGAQGAVPVGLNGHSEPFASRRTGVIADVIDAAAYCPMLH